MSELPLEGGCLCGEVRYRIDAQPVDSSAVLAILFDEPDARRHAGAIMAASACRMSVANVLEASIALERRGGDTAAHALDTLLETARSSRFRSPSNTWKQHAAHGAASARAITRRH